MPALLALKRRRYRRLMLLKSRLMGMLVFVSLFGLGMLCMHLLHPLSAEAVVQRSKGAPDYYFPVASRQLTVTLVPLVPGTRIEKELSARSSATLSTARDLTSPDGLDALAASLSQLYPFSYEVGAPMTIPDICFDSTRKQYDTKALLHWLSKHTAPGSFKTVGLLYSDIYDEGYNFLFGQARIGGPVCVASASRMGGNLKRAKLTAQQRWHSIVRHELGHTLGLQHVKDRKSVMAYGDSLAELDTQGDTLTRADWVRLKELHPIKWEK